MFEFSVKPVLSLNADGTTVDNCYRISKLLQELEALAFTRGSWTNQSLGLHLVVLGDVVNKRIHILNTWAHTSLIWFA